MPVTENLENSDMKTEYVIGTWNVASLPIVGSNARFPVRRIFCVGRNYVEHQKEMGATAASNRSSLQSRRTTSFPRAVRSTTRR